VKDDKILRAIGNIDEDLIDRAAPADYDYPKDKSARVTFAPWLRWGAPVAACLIIAVAIAVPTLLKQPPTADGSGHMQGAGDAEYGGTGEAPIGGNVGDTLTGSASSGSVIPSPGLSLDGGVETAACYADPKDWRGLTTENYILCEQGDDTTAARRIPLTTLDDLVLYADAFVLVPNIHETAQDGDNMQTSIAEYAETIGDRITTRQWDDHTVSTGSRVLIRQQLIGGCTMDDPSNLLRKGGVYLLPIKFNPDWGAYEVVGDLDVLFELDDEGRIVSHSQWEDFNKYDGRSLPELLDDVRALYPVTDAEFAEEPISTVEQAKNQVITAYNASGFRKFSAKYDSETVIKDADVYLFMVSFGGKDSEYAAIAKENGAFIRGEMKSDGDINIFGGLGSFPKNSR